MKRRAARIDDNQNEIVEGARKLVSVSVLVLSSVGRGCPDILVGYKGRNFLFEIKDGSKKPSERALTAAEQAFFSSWWGHAGVVENLEELMKYIGYTAPLEGT